MTTALEQYCKGLIDYGHVHNYNVYLGYSYDNGRTLSSAELKACHADLSWGGKKATDVYTSLCRHPDLLAPVAEAYWKFILDKDASPWRKWLHNTETIFDDKGKTTIGLRLSGDIPAQVLGNLAIATRTPTEHVQCTNTWFNLVESGFDPTTALWLSVNFVLEDKEFIYAPPRGHYPFNLGDVSLKRLREGDPKFSNPSLRDGGNYTPCNSIWRGGKASAGFLHKNLCAGAKGYVGAFQKLRAYFDRFEVQKRSLLPLEDVKKFIEENKEIL